jgi:hypothetical protein
VGESIGLEELKEVDDALHTSLSWAASDQFNEVGISESALVRCVTACCVLNNDPCTAAPVLACRMPILFW